jgi:hypothetical protein
MYFGPNDMLENGMDLNATIVRKFDEPDEVREFPLGKFEIVNIGGMTLGRATYQPGWKWSEHVAPTAGTPLCPVEHLGMCISGHAVAYFPDQDKTVDLLPGEIFYIPPDPHDSWVVGEEPYVSIHFLGAEEYAE